MSNLKDWSSYSDDEDNEPSQSQPQLSTQIETKPAHIPHNKIQNDHVRNTNDRNSYDKDNQSRKPYRSDQRADRGPPPATNHHHQVPKDGPTPFVVIATNLLYAATIDDVGTFFADGGCRVADVIMSPDSKGIAFVYMEDKESQEKSREAEGAELMGRSIHIRIHNSFASKPSYVSSGVDDRHHDYSHRPRGGHTDRPRGDARAPREHVPYNKQESDTWDRKTLPQHPPRTTQTGSHDRSSGKPLESRIVEIVKPPEPPVVKERPVLKLQPRTAPVEEIGKPVAAANIFGGGKPRDVFVHEKPADEAQSEPVPTVTVVHDTAISKKEDKTNDNKNKYNQEQVRYRTHPRNDSSQHDKSNSNEVKPSAVPAQSPQVTSKPPETRSEVVDVQKKDTVKKSYVVEESNTKRDDNVRTERGAVSGRGRGRSDERRKDVTKHEGDASNIARKHHESSDTSANIEPREKHHPSTNTGGRRGGHEGRGSHEGRGREGRGRGPPSRNPNPKFSDDKKQPEASLPKEKSTPSTTVLETVHKSQNAFSLLQDHSDED